MRPRSASCLRTFLIDPGAGRVFVCRGKAVLLAGVFAERDKGE
jgi:hypothetical protein